MQGWDQWDHATKLGLPPDIECNRPKKEKDILGTLSISRILYTYPEFLIKLENSMNFPRLEILVSISRFSRSSGNPMKYRGQYDEEMKNRTSFFDA